VKKIVIIGSAGAGKTTLARNLEFKLHLNAIHLDRLFWKRDWKGETKDNWKRETKDTRIEILDKIVQEKQWIIEGTYIGSSEPRLKAADTIIILDINPSICLLRILKRHRPFRRLKGLILKQKREYQELKRRDLPEGCVDKLTLFRIFKVLVFPFQERRTLEQKLHYYNTKQIIWLRSSKEVEEFLAQLRQDVNDRRDLFHEQTHLQVSEFATT
jgi:adenylate kinase family enzyme